MKNLSKTFKSNYALILWIFGLVLFSSCEKEQLPQENYSATHLETNVKSAVKAKKDVVDIVTTQMNLEMKSHIPSGWTTFRYENLSNSTHFILFERLPGDKTVEDSKLEIVPVFQEGMDFIAAGDWAKVLEAFGKLPAWSAEVIYSGGVGLVSPGGTVEFSMYVEPGNYALECYVKSSGGVFHSAAGMITGLTVTPENNDNIEPGSTLEVSISSQEGIKVPDNVRPGKHNIKVLFEDQTVYGHFLGHDVHLMKLDATANLFELNSWMNWSDPNAFKNPVPSGVEFLGGMQELPSLSGEYTSKVGYFDAHLKPGTYAFIAEVPDPMSKNMFKVFTVPSAAQ